MPPLHFSFTPRRRIASPLGWGLLLAGVSIAAAVGLHVRSLEAQREALDWHLARFAKPIDAPSTMSSEALAEADQLNGLHRQLQASWQPVFESLEDCASPEVAILSIRVAGRTGNLQIEAQARALSDALDYVASLQRQAVFRNVLMQRDARQADTVGHPLAFTVRAEILP